MMNYLRIPAQSIFTAFYFIGSVALFNINPGNTQDLKTSKTQEYIENLKSKNNKVRENAATSLIRIGGLAIPSLEGVDDNAMAYILPRILKESSLCKKICNTRIGEINDKEKILSLINSDLNSHKKDLRLIALVFLAEYSVHDKEFISAFIPIFRNELDEEVRDISEKLVAGVGDSAIPQLMIAMKDEDERIHNSAVQSFVNMGERATDSLLKVFDDKNERIRIGAVDALGQITQLNINQSLKFYQKNSSEYKKIKQERYKLISAFNRALEDKSPEVRFKAANALQFFEADAKQAIPNLIKALSLSAGNYPNNFQIVETISKIGMEAVPEITAELELETSNKHVRAGLATALGKIGGDKKVEYVPLITKLLMDKESAVRTEAAEALGDIGYESRGSIHELFSLLKDNELSVRRQAVVSIGKIAYSLSDDTKTLSDNDLINTINELDRVLKFLNQKNINLNNIQSLDRTTYESIKHIHRSLNNLKNEKDSRVYTKILSNPLIISIIGILGFYFVLFVALFLLLRFRPLCILKINNVLSRVPSDLSLPPQLDTAFKIFSSGLRLFFVIGLWHYHPRVLDSWVAARIIIARKNFSIKETVSARSAHVNAVPICMKIRDQDKLISDLNKENLSFLFSQRNCLLIYGEGGSGKTSLACQLAKWSMSDTESEHLCENLMLPILLEQDLDLKVPEGKSLFIEEIRGQLKALTGESEPIPEEFCKQLLLNRRILVIVDRFSEMSEGTRKSIRPVQPDFPANALIVTSRRKEELDQVHKDTIEPLRIDKDRLSPFIGDYLNSRQKRNLFNDHEFLEACSHMKKVVGQRNVTILLAKLYAEHMIARKEGFTKEYPENIPDLMLWYLSELNRGVGVNAPDNYVVHKHAKIIAWECMKNNLRPGSANREEALLALGENEPESSLRYLQDKLRIIQSIRPAEIQLKFTLDPLAEYLAGMYIIGTFKDSEEEWNKFFATVDRFPLDEIQGFLLAINECIQIRMGENIIPQLAIENLRDISCSISIRQMEDYSNYS